MFLPGHPFLFMNIVSKLTKLHNNIGHIATISRIEEDKYVRLDSFTIRNLELVHSSNEDGKSLLQIIDKTSSPMGARLLRRWLLFPLKDAKAINARLDVVDTMFRNPQTEEDLKVLKGLKDILEEQ